MRYSPWIGGFAAIALLIGLGGCSETREALGLAKSAPDEFQVVAHAPLSLPPNFNLRPPQPGAPRPQEGSPRNQAESAMFGETTTGTGRTQTALFGDLVPGGALGGAADGGYGAASGPSAGELAFLESAGAVDADPSIRSVIDRETAAMATQDSEFLERLVFWRDPVPFGTVVDPAKEQQRLQENAALGKPVTEGETPTIERKQPALLEGLF